MNENKIEKEEKEKKILGVWTQKEFRDTLVRSAVASVTAWLAYLAMSWIERYQREH